MSHKNALPSFNIVVFQIGVVFDWFVVTEEVITEPRRRGVPVGHRVATSPKQNPRHQIALTNTNTSIVACADFISPNRVAVLAKLLSD